MIKFIDISLKLMVQYILKMMINCLVIQTIHFKSIKTFLVFPKLLDQSEVVQKKIYLSLLQKKIALTGNRYIVHFNCTDVQPIFDDSYI